MNRPTYFMKNALLTLALVSLLGTHAMAQEGLGPLQITEKPGYTKPVYIAMLWHRLNNYTPDFEKMAQKSASYVAANELERPAIMAAKSANLRDIHSLITPTEPIYIEYKTRSSQYDARRKQIRLVDLSPTTFFDYTYLGQRYAVIPNKITAFATLSMEQEMAMPIMKESGFGKNLTLLFTLTPKAADKNPLLLNKKNYNLILADIAKVEIWSADGTMVFWEAKVAEEAPQNPTGELLQLYQ